MLDALDRYFGPLGEKSRARCIAWHESRYRPRAISPTGDYGVMQINIATHRSLSRTRLLEIEYNVSAAKRIYLDARRKYGNGWDPWATRGSCGA